MEEGKSEAENSMFETSHVLGTLLASSPLLAQSWQKCTLADASASGFVADVHGGGGGGTAYVAFSGVPAALSLCPAGDANKAFCPVGLGNGAARALFAPLVAAEAEIGEPVVVQALALHFFLVLCNSPDFQTVLNQIKGKAVVFTGHSIGGAIASLAALHYLCALSSSTSVSAPPLLCITFGSPLLGNEALSRAILRERWGGNFCHVVSQHDVIPRLLFCPLDSVSPLLVAQMQLQQCSVRNPHVMVPVPESSEDEREELRKFIHMHIGTMATEQKPTSPVTQDRSPYRPFGTYALCSSEGAVCVDNPTAVVQMLYMTFVSWWSPSLSIEAAHLCYGDLVVKMPQHFLLKKGICIEDESSESNYETGISLALEASGIGVEGTEAISARECLKMSKRMGRSPNLNCANLAIKLGKITPCRAQIEWYKASFDDEAGYYDAFKLRKSPKKYSKANMNRIKLGHFWDSVLTMLESNQLPHDFHKRAKWVNAARFYQLLVEPLDIAEYYRNQNQKTKGHYLTHGRERRYELFDKWWKERYCNNDATNAKRSKFASLTQDSCFWAKVEEAKDLMEIAKTETDGSKLVHILKKLTEFEWYSKKLVDSKEVSIDVLAPFSSYKIWIDEWREIKLRNGFHV